MSIALVSDFAVNVGELLMTECEMVNGFIDPRLDSRLHFTRGYGLVFGMSERSAMAMALVDRVAGSGIRRARDRPGRR